MLESKSVGMNHSLTNSTLTVREMEAKDAELIAGYWSACTPGFLQSMGADVKKLPGKEELIIMLQKQVETSIEEKRSYCLIWQKDGLPIGHCNTNPTTFGKEAYMHLHLWNYDNRNKGIGLLFVKLALPLFFSKLQLQYLYSEPFAHNIAPNRILERAGFVLEKEYVTVPGYINFEQPVKRWVLSAERAKELL